MNSLLLRQNDLSESNENPPLTLTKTAVNSDEIQHINLREEIQPEDQTTGHYWNICVEVLCTDRWSMDRKPYVVSGEAPESDSGGEEFAVSDTPFQQAGTSSAGNLQGIIVAGEAPESDEEREEPGSVSSISSAASVSSESSLTASARKGYKGKKSDSKYSSLLHKKLRERNISLHKNISEFAYSTLTSASRDLNLANQQLLRSQVQLQEAATSLHILQSHLTQLHTKIAAVCTSAFIPQIYIQHSKE